MKLSIESIYSIRRKNQSMSFIDILTHFHEDYEIEESEIVKFVKKNETFKRELIRECESLRLIKHSTTLSSASLESIFG